MELKNKKIKISECATGDVIWKTLKSLKTLLFIKPKLNYFREIVILIKLFVSRCKNVKLKILDPISASQPPNYVGDLMNIPINLCILTS